MESPALGLSLLGLLAVFVLVLLNAYFVATEFALVAVRHTQLQLWDEEGRHGAGSAVYATKHLDDAIAATQLGITLASIALGFAGHPALLRFFAPPLQAAGFGESVVDAAAFAGAFSIITFVHVVVGELAPKAIALEHPGRVALLFSRPLLVFARVFRPILWVMNGAGNALVRLLGVRPASQGESAHSQDELSLLVSEARAAGRIRPYAGRILANVFGLTATQVQDVMVPREKVFAIDRTMRGDDLLDVLKDTGFTRLPVYEGTLNNIIGILHAKDLFHVYARDGVAILEDAIRPVVFIRPELLIMDALRQFRRGRRHLAVVRDAEGQVLGVCTLEDVLEEIVGEIEDEHDEPTPAGSA